MSGIEDRFEPTTVGLNARVNLIDWSTGIQIFDGWSMESLRNGTEWYWVGVPANVRNRGVRAVKGAASLPEAFKIAAELTPAAARKMARLHLEALRINQPVDPPSIDGPIVTGPFPKEWKATR